MSTMLNKLTLPASETAKPDKRKPSYIKQNLLLWKDIFTTANFKTILSMLIMGSGQFLHKQWVKGIAFLTMHIGFLFYFVLTGAKDFFGFFTLGFVKADPWQGIKGDNSVDMLILGILSFILVTIFLTMYIINIKDAYFSQVRREDGKTLETNKQTLRRIVDKDFYKTALVFPIIGVSIFNVLPVIFMIVIAFTDYGGAIVPPELVRWTGLQSFIKVLALSQFAPTFVKVLLWNIVWAVSATLLNYFGGLGLALLYNKKCIKGKAFWRAFPILAYAIPGFITLLAFKFMFANGGPINLMIISGGGSAISFLGGSAMWSARIIGLLVNMWICLPTSMLLATSVLSNMNTDLYEAASIDGATPWKQFISLTLPFVIFATTPVLISQFIGNFNNFGIFYFLRGGLQTPGYFLANDTDLLINWLYKLSIKNNYYAIGAAISLIIFVFTSAVSLIAYVMSPAYKAENTYR